MEINRRGETDVRFISPSWVEIEAKEPSVWEIFSGIVNETEKEGEGKREQNRKLDYLGSCLSTKLLCGSSVNEAKVAIKETHQEVSFVETVDLSLLVIDSKVAVSNAQQAQSAGPFALLSGKLFACNRCPAKQSIRLCEMHTELHTVYSSKRLPAELLQPLLNHEPDVPRHSLRATDESYFSSCITLPPRVCEISRVEIVLKKEPSDHTLLFTKNL
ncbi:hypothetical protein K0M31_009081 [Melipona bicolor]|uniref:Uncharacterized protein n=1 Tax=Melipona bicolor TaxID=60889 RepID=A0AA40FNW2_9HYME|nr:hypothetical protein K0M31_009081 [Melipona bicolor]